MSAHVPFFAVTVLAAASAVAEPAIDLEHYRMVDLSHAFDESTLYWPTAPSRFELERLSHGVTPGGYFYSASALCTPEHGGTHLDAPIHFAEGAASVDEIPLERLVGPAVVIDVSSQAAEHPDYRLTRADLGAFEERHGRIARGAIVLLRTGWASRWPDARRYLGDDTPGDASGLHFPSFGEDVVTDLLERGAAMLGVDTASIDHGPASEFRVHRLAAAAGVPGLENLAALDELPEVGSWLIALPMKIGGGSGGPVRVIALVPR